MLRPYRTVVVATAPHDAHAETTTTEEVLTEVVPTPEPQLLVEVPVEPTQELLTEVPAKPSKGK